MKNNIEGKVVIITGSSSGLGEATALPTISLGYRYVGALNKKTVSVTERKSPFGDNQSRRNSLEKGSFLISPVLLPPKTSKVTTGITYRHEAISIPIAI